MTHHWHAYAWTGHALPPDAERHDLSGPLPPLQVAHWLRKPADRIAATFTEPGEALGWLEQQLQEVRPVPYDLPAERRLAWARDELERRGDVVWGYYTAARGYASRAVIACPREGERCPAPLPARMAEAA